MICLPSRHRFTRFTWFVFFITALAPAWPGHKALAGHGQPAPVQDIGEVMVLGTKMDEFIRKNPSQVVSMDAREIEARNFLQVSEALGSMPGVDVKLGPSGLGTRIAIRGGGGSGSVLVLIDGRPAATMQFGGADLSSIPIDIIEKITVFKPPVPVWLGSGSAAGAVYIQTRPKKISTSKGVRGKVRIFGGSFGHAAASATTQADQGPGRWLMSAGATHKDGKRKNSDKDQGHLTLGYARKQDGRTLDINAKAYVSDHGVAGPVYNPTPDARQRYEKASLDMKVKGFTQMADYEVKTWADLKQLDETAQNNEKSTLDTLAAGLGGDLFLLGDDDNNELRIGTRAEHNRVDHTRTGKHDRTQVSTHTEYTLRCAPFVYTLGASAGYTNDFHFSPGGHAGISFAPAKATLIKANAGYSEQVPSFGQLYQPSHGAVDHVRGNPNLSKEKILSLNLGLEQNFLEKHQVSVSLFRTDTWDLIKYQRGPDQVSTPFNVDRAYKQGVETSIRFKVSDITGLDISHVWQQTRNRALKNELSYAPAHTVKLILKTVLPWGTKLEWTTRACTDQFSDTLNTEEEKLTGYTATDVKLIHPFVLMAKKSLVFVHINNLFDKDYASHFGYPNDGFKVEAGFSISF